MYIFRLHEQFIMKIVLIFFVYFSDLYVQPQIFLGGSLRRREKEYEKP